MLRPVQIDSINSGFEPCRNRSLHEITENHTNLPIKKTSSFPRRTSEKFVIEKPEFNEEANRHRALTDLRRLSLCKKKKKTQFF